MAEDGQTDPVERRKNPSRRRAPIDVKYQVFWNEERHTFDVYRAKVKTRAYAHDKATAIRLAIGEAEREASGLKVTVSALQNGKETVEWSR